MSSLLIPLTGLKGASQETEFPVSGAFFREFGEGPVLDADVKVMATLSREGADFALELRYEGVLTLSCDRCLQEMSFPVQLTNRVLLSRRGQEDAADGMTLDDGREVIPLEASAKEFDATQLIYDDLSLSVPISHTHPEGGCDPTVLRYLTDNPGGGQEPMDSPFSALGKLLS